MAKKSSKVVRISETNAEPTWDREYTQTDIHEAFSWYNTNKNEKDAAKYLGIKDNYVASKFTSLAWAMRMKSRGCQFSVPSQETFQRLLDQFNELIKPKADPVPVAAAVVVEDNVISIQERVQAKTDFFIAELEAMVDEYGIRGDAAKMNAYQWFTKQEVKSIHASKIAEFFEARLGALEHALKDPQLREYYSGYNKSRLLNIFKCYANIIADAKKIASNASAARKPRKKKPVSVEKMVRGIKFLQKNDEFKLQSIDPVKIPGASQLWVFNVKTRKLGVYNALDAAGLMVKGSSILNYSVDTSICKTLRKPEKVLKTVLDGGKIALRKVLEEVNAKASNLNGRLNKDTILLRIS
jgi:hypothetical protein